MVQACSYKAYEGPMLSGIRIFFLDVDHTVTREKEGRQYLIEKYVEETGDPGPKIAMGSVVSDLRSYRGLVEGIMQKRRDAFVKLNSIVDTLPPDFLARPGLYDELELRPGIKEFVDYCTSNEVDIVGVTLAYPAFCEHLSKKFDVKIVPCQSDYEKRDVYSRICSERGVHPEQTGCIGDGPQDMLHPLTFKVQVGEFGEIKDHDVKVDDFYQLLSIVSKGRGF